MNRVERRNLEKQGIDKETIEKLNKYDQPCTLLEVVKLARAIAEDVANESLEDYRRRSTATIVALSLQLDVMRGLLAEKGILNEEEVQERYTVLAKEFEDKQRDYLNQMKEAESQHLNDTEESQESNPVASASFSGAKVSPVEVTVMRDNEGR